MYLQSTVLHQLNTLAKLIGEDFLERRRTAPFTVMEDNLSKCVQIIGCAYISLSHRSLYSKVHGFLWSIRTNVVLQLV